MRAVGVGHRQVEAALEEAPGHAARVQQVADVLSAELHQRAGCGRADIANRVGIADQREAAVAVLRSRRRRHSTDRLTPLVWPEIRLIAPGVDGPKVVLYELSLIAKRCA